jgi:hypothetical protein
MGSPSGWRTIASKLEKDGQYGPSPKDMERNGMDSNKILNGEADTNGDSMGDAGPKRYPDGMKDFREMVSGGYHFVDKTMMIAGLCGVKDQTFLYTRPRRFGKSMNLSMLDYFFNIRYKDERNIFEGLRIDACEGCGRYRNAYPVVRMNFGDLRSDSREAFRESLVSMVADVGRTFRDLTETCVMSAGDRDFILRCASSSLNYTETVKAVRTMCGILAGIYGEKTVILVDEYDQCIQDIYDPSGFEEIADELRPFMEQTFKFNDNIQFGVVTGIMPLAKTSMLSSFNNASVCSILEAEGDEYFGFTEDEVIRLLEDTGNSRDRMDEIREWYDGYHFGNADVYNPYSVILYLKNGCRPKAYWVNLTGGGISQDLVSSMGAESLNELRSVYESDATFESVIDTTISYAEILRPGVKASSVYSYLAMAGYLKTVEMGIAEGKSLCRISRVNKEVSYAFGSLIERASEVERLTKDVLSDVYGRDAASLGSDIEALLSGLSMDRTWMQDADPTARHNMYRDVIMAYLMTPEVLARSETPKGYGKTDIFIPRSGGDPPVVIEIKTTVDPRKDLDSLASEGLEQIRTRRYADEPGIEDAICIGIGIRMKTVRVAFR